MSVALDFRMMAPAPLVLALCKGAMDMSTNNRESKRSKTSFRVRAGHLALMAMWIGTIGAVAFAAPNNGPPTGPTDPTNPPDVPCDPPLPQPGFLLPSHVQGQLRETCGGVLRPVANKPIELILNVRVTPSPCHPSNIPPPPPLDIPVATGTTDANGEFYFEFYPEDFGVNPDAPYQVVKVQIRLYDDTNTVPIWETAYYGENPDLEYFVYENIIFCLTEGTRIYVESPSGQPAFNAEVFVNGALHPQRTNPNGMITINPPLPAGSTVVARAMVHESRSERGKHNQGSTQNWKYRAYITSMPLMHDAAGNNPTFTPVEVTDPNGAYELKLTREASYIGLHLVASIEWDASPSELGSFATRMRMASDYLFNATDGQMLIERVDVFDDGVNWEQADFRVYADLSLRAHVDWPSGGFWTAHDASFWRSNWMHMSRSNDHPVYVHEFGHYGLQLKDEYEDNGGDHCAHGVGGSNPLFDANGGKASCMMFNQWNYTKICSGHQDNPHLTGTKQEDEDCWSEIKRHFTAEAPGPNGAPRWKIKTPVDRGVIVNALCCVPLSGWDPLVEQHDANNQNLCQPVQFQWASHNGFALGAKVFSKNSSGRTIIQGVTDANGIIAPFQGSVRTVAGLHVGDTIGATWYVYTSNGYVPMVKKRTFTDADCLSAMVVLNVLPGQAPPSPQEQLVEGEAMPFNLAAQLEPGTALGEAVIRVRAGAVLGAAPAVQLSVDGESDVRDVVMALDATSGDWIGHVAGLPEQFAVVADVNATDETGAQASTLAAATFMGAMHDEESDLAAADGRVKLTIPADALSEPTAIAIGNAVARLPDEFPGRIITGPIAMVTPDGTATALAKPSTVHFQLAFDTEEALLAAHDPALMMVLAFEEATGLWTELASSYHAGEMAIEAEISKLGTFLLLERGLGTGDAGDGADADAQGTGDAGSEIPGGELPGSADCGTGACGSGAALASPLMIGVLGLRRMRRGRRVGREGGDRRAS